MFSRGLSLIPLLSARERMEFMRVDAPLQKPAGRRGPKGIPKALKERLVAQMVFLIREERLERYKAAAAVLSAVPSTPRKPKAYTLVRWYNQKYEPNGDTK